MGISSDTISPTSPDTIAEAAVPIPAVTTLSNNAVTAPAVKTSKWVEPVLVSTYSHAPLVMIPLIYASSAVGANSTISLVIPLGLTFFTS